MEGGRGRCGEREREVCREGEIGLAGRRGRGVEGGTGVEVPISICQV